MKVLTAIDQLDGYFDYHLCTTKKYRSLFLAGGITDCPDWQSIVIAELKKFKYAENLIVFNPRRPTFDTNNPEESIKQIAWEYKYLDLAQDILFWFPKETLCPITLFEYGKNLLKSINNKKLIFVGTHPEYKRRQDLLIQTKLQNPNIQILDDINSLTMLYEYHLSVLVSQYGRI